VGDDYQLPDHPACPFCDGTDTEVHSPFGTALSVATYWCRACRTAFEWVKWGVGSDAEERTGRKGECG
jgi:hypothetical protein